MRFRSTIWVVALASLVALAMACGSDGGDGQTDATSGGAPAQQSSGRVAPPTPTLPPALAEATQAAAVPYRGAYGAGDTDPFTAAQAVEYIGKQGKVCGTVMATVFEPEHQYKATFLNFDKADDPDFFAYFWHSGMRFGKWPDISDASIDLTNWFDGKKICVQGRIGQYRDKASIKIGQWGQIEIQEE